MRLTTYTFTALTFLLVSTSHAQIAVNSANIKNYAPSLTGAGASGEWNISAKKLNGYEFDARWGQSSISRGGTLLGLNGNTIMLYNADAIKDFIGLNDKGETLYSVTKRGSTTYSSIKVDGTMEARKVKVDQPGWSDFVFAPSYRLKPLPEVASYIQQHNRLPDVPAADSVARHGTDVAATQALLLQKIEELTLYIIAQDKRIGQLEAERSGQPAAYEAKQQVADTFTTTGYVIKDTSVFLGYNYTITFIHKTNPALFLRKVYQDSTYATPLGWFYCVNETMNGPYEFYLTGGLTSKGRMNMGKEEGEKLIYNADGKLLQKGFYKAGVKTGTWEYYDKTGTLYQLKAYDANGNLLKTTEVGPTH